MVGITFMVFITFIGDKTVGNQVSYLPLSEQDAEVH